MSLADELLADLGSDEEFESQLEGYQKYDDEDMVDTNGNDLDALMGREPLKITTTGTVSGQLGAGSSNLGCLSSLMPKIQPILDRINVAGSLPISNRRRNTDEDPIYQLLVEANGYSAEIDEEVSMIHNFVKESYSKRFDELASLVPSPVDYAKAVKAIGNDPSGIDQKGIDNFLPPATIMSIMMFSLDNGSELSSGELDRVFEACDLLLALDQAKWVITEFVSSRLSIYAPNVAQIVSPHVAAQLLGITGGLKSLAITPSANIPALGAKKRVSAGFGQVGVRREGFLYHSEVVQGVPVDKRKQAMKIVSGKLVLAARLDMARASTDGSEGRKWRQGINEVLEKLVEPPESKGSKALRLPDDKPSKKRGGRRLKKFKQQFELSDMRKDQNRMAFGQSSDALGAYDESVGLGVAGSSGQMRALAVDNKTRAKMSKAMQTRLQGLSGTVSSIPSGHTSTVGRAMGSGLASSLTFTPVQGVELVDPSRVLNRSRTSGEGGWFTTDMLQQLKPNEQHKGALNSHSSRMSETAGSEVELSRKRKLSNTLITPDPKRQDTAGS